tara:strand:+ start:586 stop:1092 length:507 start_codon:yes stop_codon:yes gene_type:complete
MLNKITKHFMKIDKRTQYDLLVEKIICVKQMFEGTYIPDIICSYLCYDFKGILNKRRFKSICGDPLYLPVTFMNSLVNNARVVNDTRGRYMFNATTIFQYFETVWEDGDDQALELKTKLKSVYLGPVRFCQYSGEYLKDCKCGKCDGNKPDTYTIVFSDSEEEADIVF